MPTITAKEFKSLLRALTEAEAVIKEQNNDCCLASINDALELLRKKSASGGQ